MYKSRVFLYNFSNEHLKSLDRLALKTDIFIKTEDQLVELFHLLRIVSV